MTRVFVYGTLRKGQGNGRHFFKNADAVIENCTATGGLYFVYGDGGYPVAKFDEEGTIIGDVFVFNDDEDPGLAAAYRMEIYAGYVEATVAVTYPDGTVHDCMAFHYKRTPDGTKIEDGDWVAASAYVWG